MKIYPKRTQAIPGLLFCIALQAGLIMAADTKDIESNNTIGTAQNIDNEDIFNPSCVQFGHNARPDKPRPAGNQILRHLIVIASIVLSAVKTQRGNSQFSILNSQSPIPNSQFPISNSQSPSPNQGFLTIYTGLKPTGTR